MKKPLAIAVTVTVALALVTIAFAIDRSYAVLGEVERPDMKIRLNLQPPSQENNE